MCVGQGHGPHVIAKSVLFYAALVQKRAQLISSALYLVPDTWDIILQRSPVLTPTINQQQLHIACLPHTTGGYK